MPSFLPPGIELKTPLTRAAVRQLHAGDIVYISGYLWSAADLIFTGVFEEGRELPIDIRQYNAMLVGRGFTRLINGKWVPQHTTPVSTTGFRYRKWIAPSIKMFNLRMVLCKDGVSDDENTIRACQEHDCVTTTVFAFPPKVLPDTCQEVREVTWADNLQASRQGLRETNFIYKARKYGPLIINIDTKGNCFTGEIARRIDEQASDVYERMGINSFNYNKL
ncbi:hypothetical protein ACFLXH_04555 [Chloroflexota bacterium]